MGKNTPLPIGLTREVGSIHRIGENRLFHPGSIGRALPRPRPSPENLARLPPSPKSITEFSLFFPSQREAPKKRSNIQDHRATTACDGLSIAKNPAKAHI